MNIYAPKLNQYNIRIRDDVCALTVHWLRIADASDENLLTARKKHIFYELHYVLDGEIAMNVSERDIIVPKDHFILVTPEHFHEITSYAPDTRKLVFGFDAELSDKRLDRQLKEAVCAVRAETAFLRKCAELLVMTPEQQSADRLTDLSAVIGIQLRCLTEAFLFALVTMLLSDNASDGAPSGITKNSYKQDLVDGVIKYIRSGNAAGRGFATVGEIAEAFHISKRQLDRVCVETTGKTARRILDEERLRCIRDMLSVTGYTLNSIAARAGFASEQSLVRFFHRNEGYTPSQYRKYILK